MKFIVKNLLIIAFLLLSGLSYAQPTTYYTEPFNNNCSLNCSANGYNGWTVTNATANGIYPNTWFVTCAEVGMTFGLCGQRSCTSNLASLHIGIDTSTYNFYKNNYTFPCTTGDCGAVYFSGAGDGNAVTDQRIESPLINTSKTECTIYLTFNYILGGNSTLDNMTVEFSGDNGTTWTEIGAPPKTDTCNSTPEEGVWTKYQVALPDSLTGIPYKAVKIAFRWVNNDNGIGSSRLSCAIDSVSVFGNIRTPFGGDIVTASPSNTQCTGSVFVMGASTIDTNYYYIWNGTVVQDTIHVSFNSAGVYTEQLEVGNSYCEYSNFNYDIYVISCTNPIAKFTLDSMICKGQCDTFVNASLVNTAATYTWSINGAPFTNFTTSGNPYMCFNTTTGSPWSVKLVVRYNNGNADSVTHTVTVQVCNAPIAKFTAAPIPVCKGNTVTFTDESIRASTWSWTFNGGAPDTSTSSAPPPISYADTGSFYALLVVADTNGNISSDSILIQVDSCPPLMANFTATTLICDDDCIAFTNESSGNPVSYAWTFSGGTPPTSTQPSPEYICYNQPGTYDVTLKVYDVKGDSNTLTKPAYIIVNPLPTASIMVDSTDTNSVGTDTSTVTIVEGQSVALTASGGLTYSWYPATNITGGTNTSANITVTPPDTTTYTVTVTDVNGCTAQQKVYIDVISDNTIFVPTLFTPNNDGINDYFKVYTAGLVTKFQLLVFDRWGAEIFSANDKNTGWDGKLNGKQCSEGVYVWYYKLTFVNGLQASGKGSITLLR